ncbi:geranylgeranyl reductase family protein [bacterium]|nr:MAG: geranylgeranyl reductase family protein [bacterium]
MAARDLAAAGVRVLILDRERFPRYKACAGGIPRRTRGLLPFPIDAVVEESVHLFDISVRNSVRFVRDSGRPFLDMVMRDRFDALLLERAEEAGAEFRPATMVRSVEETGRGVTVRGEGFEADASFVVGADGANSVTARSLGLGAGLASCAALEVELRLPPLRRATFDHTVLIEMDYRPWGYSWVFPKEGALSIGIVLPDGQGRAMRTRLTDYISRLGLSAAEVVRERGHNSRFRRGGEAIATPRAALTGDAAGLADEFTQEGIVYAIQSGRLAALEVLRAAGREGDLRSYERAVDREIAPELRAARLLGYIGYGILRRLRGPWLGVAPSIGPLWKAFFAVHRGESSYHRELQRIPLLPSMAARRLGVP